MKRTFKFYRDYLNRWFVDLPEWEGDVEELEMVLGADTMLDIIAQGEGEVMVTLSTESFENYNIRLIKLDDKTCSEGGAWYHAHSDFSDFEVWLCHVSEFVFGEHPENIYLV